MPKKKVEELEAEPEMTEKPKMDLQKILKIREMLAAVLFVFSVLMLFALASYQQSDIPGEIFGGSNRVKIQNLCGKIGVKVSHFSLQYFGYASYLIAIIGICWSLALFVQKSLRDIPMKLAGLGFLVWASATFLSMAFRNASSGLPIPTAGGVIGEGGAFFLNQNLGILGSFMTLALIVFLSLLLATDWLFIDLARSLYAIVGNWTRHLMYASQEPAVFVPEVREAPAKSSAKKAIQNPVMAEDVEDECAEEDHEGVMEMLNVPHIEAEEDDGEEVEAEDAPEPEPDTVPENEDADAQAKREAAEREKKRKHYLKLQEKLRAKKEKEDKRKKKELEKARKLREQQIEEGYRIPSTELLDESKEVSTTSEDEDIQHNIKVIEETLASFGIQASVVEVERGPVITQYELELGAGIKVSKILSLSDNLKMALKTPSLRLIAPIPGKATVGVELPNKEKETVRLRELIETNYDLIQQKSLPIVFGKDSSGRPLIADLAAMPHLLIAGTTGSGKSVCINSIVLSLLLTRRPDEVRLVLIDPKTVEMATYRDMPHLLHPVVTDMKKANQILEWIVSKMEERYELFAKVGTRNIKNFNNIPEEKIRESILKSVPEGEEIDENEIRTRIPYIVVIIDELADLMMTSAKEVESSIVRLAQKSRAVGIHLVLATQRPSVDVITGLIKANMSCRVAFQTMSRVDSKTILDTIGAEKLLGMGDMLFMPPGTAKLLRAQAAYVDENEVHRVVASIKEQLEPIYEEPEIRKGGIGGDGEGGEDDDMFDEAVRVVLETQRGSVSLLQRRLGIGYSRASRLVDMMAERGIVGDYKGAQAREVLFNLEEWEAAQSK